LFLFRSGKDMRRFSLPKGEQQERFKKFGWFHDVVGYDSKRELVTIRSKSIIREF